MFTHRQIAAFQEVMRSGSLTSAAEYLNTSQPGVSRLIKDLEENLGFPLFIRHGSRIVPTQAARDLWEVVERSFLGLNYIAEMADRIRTGTNASLSIAASPVFAATLVADAIGELRQSFDLEAINTIRVTTLPVVREIALRRAELGITLLDHHTHDTDLIKTQKLPFCAISGHQSEFDGKHSCQLSDFEGRPFVAFDESTVSGQMQNSWFSTMAAPPGVAIKSYLANVVSALVLKGFGFAIVDPWTAREHRAKGGGALPMVGDLSLNISYITPLGTQVSRVAEALIAAMDEQVAQIQTLEFLQA